MVRPLSIVVAAVAAKTSKPQKQRREHHPAGPSHRVAQRARNGERGRTHELHRLMGRLPLAFGGAHRPSKYRLTVGMQYLQSNFGSDPRVVAAGTMIALIPILVLFVVMQKQFFKGVESGAVKG